MVVDLETCIDYLHFQPIHRSSHVILSPVLLNFYCFIIKCSEPLDPPMLPLLFGFKKESWTFNYIDKPINANNIILISMN